MNQTAVNFSAGILGAFITYAFGGWNELLSFFLLAIAIDYATGIVASLKEKKGLSSDVGFWGLAKKGFMLLVVILAHRLDVLMQTDFVMAGAIYFYLANELISITENYGRIGLPLPKQVKNMIAILKDRGERE